MCSFLHNPAEKAGLPPGTLIHVGEQEALTSRITMTSFSQHSYQRQVIEQLEEVDALKIEGNQVWIHCEGLGLTDFLENIGQQFDIHPLILEDILNTHQRPKFEDYGSVLFLVLKPLSSDGTLKIHQEQLSLLLLDGLLISFRERQDTLFDPIWQRLENPNGRLRGMAVDYLAHVLMDTVVDGYFRLLDDLEDIIDDLELELLSDPEEEIFTTILKLKREMIFLRKAIIPLREVLSSLQHSDTKLIKKKNLPYFRDIQDHVLRVVDTMDSYRDLVNGMLDIYLSTVSNRMNEVMKVLTIFATIFIPLTFLVGIYGMNFDYMPELHWKWSYPLLWFISILIAAVLLVYFKRKRWL